MRSARLAAGAISILLAPLHAQDAAPRARPSTVLVSGAAMFSLKSTGPMAYGEVSKYWMRLEPQSDRDGMGVGIGMQRADDRTGAYVVGKYSHMGLLGAEVGPQYMDEHLELKNRVWLGFFPLGVQAECVLGSRGLTQAYLGVYASMIVPWLDHAGYLFF